MWEGVGAQLCDWAALLGAFLPCVTGEQGPRRGTRLSTHVSFCRTAHWVKQHINILINRIINNKIVITTIPMCQALYLVLSDR